MIERIGGAGGPESKKPKRVYDWKEGSLRSSDEKIIHRVEPRHWEEWELARWIHDFGDYEVSRSHETNLAELANLLHEISDADQKKVTESPVQAIIKRESVTPISLQALGRLKFENMMVDFGGHLHFGTGSKKSTLPDYPNAHFLRSDSELVHLYIDSLVKPEVLHAVKMQANMPLFSRFVLHNHPADAHQAVLNSPSIGDVIVAGKSVAKVHFIVTREGISVYKYTRQGVHKSRQGFFKTQFSRFRDPKKIVDEEIAQGITKAFIRWDGDAGEQKKIQRICEYMANRDIEWADIEPEIVG